MKRILGPLGRTAIVLVMILSGSLVVADLSATLVGANNVDSTLPVRTSWRYASTVTVVLATTKEGRNVEGYYFPGATGKRALVISGVHGSELSGIEVAQGVKKMLLNGFTPAYSTLIIPSLFPDNAAIAASHPEHIGGEANIGRYSNPGAVDPNRQMPGAGKAYDPDAPFDSKGREIEPENRALLDLIQNFKPNRIISIHAIRDTNHAGVFADPRADGDGLALGFESDSKLAIRMANYITANGGRAAGNRVRGRANTKYHSDPPIAAAGNKQLRSGELIAHSSGISLGTWASSGVHGDELRSREAITMLTMEFPGAKRAADCKSQNERNSCALSELAYSKSIREIFLM